MNISCPHCRYERDANLKQSPPRTVNVTCPKCMQRFTTDVGKADTSPVREAAHETVRETAPPATVAAAARQEDTRSKPQGSSRPEPSGSVIPAVQPGSWAQTHKLTYNGKGSALIGIYMLNSLLTVVTLGVYHFWGKAKIRKYLLSSTELMNERFTYTGTGKELFAGWIKASVVMFFAFAVPQLLARFIHPAFGFLMFPMMMVILPFAIVSSRRYRLSRTTWHGVRFSFDGSAKEYIKLNVKGSFLTFITLGFYSPYFHVQKEGFWRSNSSYGTGSFKYTGQGKDLRKDFIKAMLLTVPTLGLCWFWYTAKRTRYDWERTSFGGLTFSSNVTGRRLLSFQAVNVLLLVLTLGFGMPFVVARNIEFIAGHLTMKGAVEFEKLSQVAPQARAVGDGLVGAFDIDMGM